MLRFALPLLALLAPLPAAAQGCQPPRPLQFARGASSAVVEGGVPRGMPDCLSITARAGQVLEASITSEERNAVFQLHPPGWRVAVDQWGGVQVNNRTLTGPDATSLRVTLPADGTYLFVVGTTRGGAGYRLTVSIR